MDSYAQTERLLIRNLKDAGCSETDIQRFLKLGQAGDGISCGFWPHIGPHCWISSMSASARSTAWTTWSIK